jgi:hypothetical protein
MEVSGQLHAPATLPQGKSPQYPLDRRLGTSQSLSGRGCKEKNSQPLPGFEFPIFQPVAQRYTTELSRLLAYIIQACKKEKSGKIFRPNKDEVKCYVTENFVIYSHLVLLG